MKSPFAPARHVANRFRRGQSLVMVTIAVPLLFGITALAVDIGFVYRSNLELLASTQSAALAGALAMAQPGATSTTVNAAVTSYSSLAGNQNAFANLPGASFPTGYPMLKCLSTATSVLGVQCYGPSNSNALVVKQQASVPLMFFQVFGFGTVNLKAMATVAMKGGAPLAPFNVAIVVDATQSMNTTDSGLYCNQTRITCTLNGIQQMLLTLSPCLPSSSSCGTVTSGNVANSVDRVALYAFPPMSTSTVAYDYNCSGTPTITSYQTPFPSTSTYQVVNFSSDYRTSDTATSLYASSNVVKAVKGAGSPCLQAVGGKGSYLAQAITMAQADLVTEHTAFPTAKNVMIVLSDGDFGTSSSNLPGASTTTGTYMSSLQQCAQAVTAAHTAATAGTMVYSIAYGAGTSGCSTDTSPTITPCQTMQNIASNSAYFFSDASSTGGSGCTSSAQPISGLNAIFKAIAVSLGGGKLIPNSTT